MLLIPLSDIYKINGVPLPRPSKANPKISGLQIFAERTADGIMHKETIRYVRHVNLVFDILTDEEIRNITNMIFTDPPTEFFSFTYKDPQRGITTITCYTNEWENELYSAIMYNGFWRNVSFNCIER